MGGGNWGHVGLRLRLWDVDYLSGLCAAHMNSIRSLP